MYDKQTPAQQNGLIYGCKLRLIGAIQGLLGNPTMNDIHVFTQPEIDKIMEICNNAKIRAKTVFEETRDHLDRFPSSGSGVKTVDRQYDGK